MEEQIIWILRENEAWAKAGDLARKHGMSEGTIHSARRRRSWREALKQEVVAASLMPGASVSVVARQDDVNANDGGYHLVGRPARDAGHGRLHRQCAEPVQRGGVDDTHL